MRREARREKKRGGEKRQRRRAHEEGIEAEDELAVAVEELEDAVDDARRVNRLRLELLHDVEELLRGEARRRQVSEKVTKHWADTAAEAGFLCLRPRARGDWARGWRARRRGVLGE